MLALARQPGAIDELGLGVLRDSFANLMFPATSTLHTHARYYFFVAYLMKYLEEEYSGQEINKIRAAHANAEKTPREDSSPGVKCMANPPTVLLERISSNQTAG